MALLTTRQHRGRKRRSDRIAKRALHYHIPSRPLLGYLQDEAIIREDIVGSTNTEIKKARCRFQRMPGRRFCHRYLRLCAGRLRRRHHRWLPLPVGTGTSRCKRPTLLSDSRATHFCRHLALEQAANWLSRTDFGALLIATALDLAVSGPLPYFLMSAYEAYSLRLPLDI